MQGCIVRGLSPQAQLHIQVTKRLLAQASPPPHGGQGWQQTTPPGAVACSAVWLGASQSGLALAGPPGGVLHQQEGLLGVTVTHDALLVLGLAEALQPQVAPAAQDQCTQRCHSDEDDQHRGHASGGTVVHDGHGELGWEACGAQCLAFSVQHSVLSARHSAFRAQLLVHNVQYLALSAQHSRDPGWKPWKTKAS